jgi:hypothetical protein
MALCTTLKKLALLPLMLLPLAAAAQDAIPSIPVIPAIPFAAPHAAAVTTPSAAGAWGGARTGQEATLSDRVVDYAIEATLDPRKHTVTGSEKLTWRNRSDQPVRSVYLHLYLNAFEGGGSTFYSEKRQHGSDFRSGVAVKDGEWGHIALRGATQNGSRIAWSFVHPDKGPASDHTVVRFDLPTPVAPGASTTLSIDFFDQLPRVTARTGYFGSFHLVGQWFPKIGVLELAGERGAAAPRWNVHEFHLDSEFYADFGNYDVRITAPKDYVIGATGERQSAPVEKNGQLTHHFVQGDVHDFAWTADNRTAPPLRATWRGAGSPDVAISVLYPPEYASNAAPALRSAQAALTYFSRTLGPYPYKTLTVVIPPHNADEAGGMEYPTFFTAEGIDDYAPNTIGDYALDFVTIHEFGHGYFYGILASNEFEEPLLDEGLNEFWDLRMLREAGTRVHLTTTLLDKIGFHPAALPFQFERLETPLEEPADPAGQNAYDRLQGIGAVYSRTATTMHDLEAALGKDATARAFRAYYQRWKFRHPSVADLRDSLAEASGQRALVEQVFDTQVYRTARVDDRVATLTSDEETPQPGTGRSEKDNDRDIEATRAKWSKAHPDVKAGADAKAGGPFPYRTTVVLRRRGAPVAQTLVVRFADGSEERVVWNNDERWQRYSWVKPVKAVSAELDPQQVHYLDANMLDNGRTLEADGAPARRWSLDFAALLQLILSLFASV